MAATFLSTAGWSVRGISRDPQSEAAKAQAAKGVGVVKGDLDDVASLVAAFEGANAIFANTDFFKPFFAAVQSPDVAGGVDARVYAHDVEFRHGLNIAEAAASPSTLKTLERFVWSSLPSSTKASNGKYKGAYHMDVKEEVEEAIAYRFPELFRLLSSVHIGFYVTNWHIFPPARPRKQSDGSFIIERPLSSSYRCPLIYAHNDTGPFVKALVVDLPQGTKVLAVSEEMTWSQFAVVWADTLGLKATYRPASEDHFDGIPEVVKSELMNMFESADEFGFTGGDPEIKTAAQVSSVGQQCAGRGANTFQLGIKIPTTSMAEYVKQEDWSSVL